MKKLIASFLAVVFLVSGCSLFKKDPQTMVTDGITKFSEVKKSTSTLLVNGTIRQSGQDAPVQISLNATAKSDLSDEKNPKGDMSLKITATVKDVVASAELLIRALDKKLYANVQNVDVSGENGAALKTQLKDLFNTWWFFPVQEGQGPADDFQQKQKIVMDKFKDAKFFINAKEDGRESVGGVSATRYRVDLDKDAVKKFLIETINLVDPTTKISPSEETQLGEELKNVEFSGAVWIGDDEILHRIKGTLTVQPTDPTSPSTTMEIDYTGSDFEKDVVVTAPESPKEFNPIALFPLLGAFGNIEGATEVPPVTPATPTTPATTTPKK